MRYATDEVELIMVQFWLAVILFVLLAVTPVILATVLNRRDSRSSGSGEG